MITKGETLRQVKEDLEEAKEEAKEIGDDPITGTIKLLFIQMTHLLNVTLDVRDELVKSNEFLNSIESDVGD